MADQTGPEPTVAELVAAARKDRAAEIAADAVAHLERHARLRFGHNPAGDVVLDLLRSAILNACGCTCTPGRRDGGPATHAEDILCPIHGTT